MSTLIVFLPPRDPAVPSQEWQLPDMPFVLLDKSGRKERAGRAALAFLPRASTTILIVAARDVVMLAASLPPLKGPRLKQALPNIVEDQLIQDAQTCHIALDPQPLPSGARVLAVIDRGWFRFIVEAFAAAGHRNLRAVPVTRCLPAVADADHAAALAAREPVHGEPALPPQERREPQALKAVAEHPPLVAALLGVAGETAPAILAESAAAAATPPLAASELRIEVAIARGALGEGLAVPASMLASTLSALAGDAALTLFALVGLPGEPHLEGEASAVDDAHLAAMVDAQPLPFDTVALAALACRFDLCQFDFESRPWRLDRATMRRLRVPIALVAASLVVAVIGANVHWLMLVRERDALNAQMTELLLNAFPKTAAVLDAPAQMKTQLERLRLAAGQLSPDDYLSLAARVAPALGPLPVNGIAALDYHDRRLDLTFKPQVTADPDFTKRLAQNGLAGELDSNTGKWTIRNRSGQ
ncbi:type II secretion system protein GspL [Trinickia sp. LjRoot230]|uniref:type II secretion system protein GspL n=1 Tax=Trinickia sp. LjRoot230 TaxID=3342288 RepID=UPI003ECF0AA0